MRFKNAPWLRITTTTAPAKFRRLNFLRRTRKQTPNPKLLLRTHPLCDLNWPRSLADTLFIPWTDTGPGYRELTGKPAKPYTGCPYPCPNSPCPWGHGFWVGKGSILLCIPTSNSESESNFSDAGNTLVKKRSGLKPKTVNDLLFVRSNQDLV